MPDFDWDGLQAIVDRQAVSGPNADYLAGIYKASLILAAESDRILALNPGVVPSLFLVDSASLIREAIQDGTL